MKRSMMPRRMLPGLFWCWSISRFKFAATCGVAVQGSVTTEKNSSGDRCGVENEEAVEKSHGELAHLASTIIG